MTLGRRAFARTATATATWLASGCKGGRTLALYNWGDYFAPEVLRRFEQAADCRTTVDIFLSEAEMAAKLRAGVGFDAAITIDYLVSSMQRDGLLARLQPLPKGVEHLGAQFGVWTARADRGGGPYAVPYLWGTTGIGFDSDRVEPPRSWEALFDSRYAGRISVLDSKGDVFDQALLASGLGINSTDKARLRSEIGPRLREQKKLLRAYDADPARALVSGQTWIAQIDSGDLLRAQRQRPSLRYVIPDEGAALWVDYVVIPAKAPHRELAMRFIEHLLDPEIAALSANHLRFGTPNQTALDRGLIDDAEDPQVYPNPEVRKRLFTSENWAGNTGKLVDELWLELRVSGG